MTDKEKLTKAVKLADAMYYAAQYLTTDASRLHKAMEEYHQFIIHEYFKEEPVKSIWHDASEEPEIDRTFLLVAPNGNSSLCLFGGKEIHSTTIGGGHSVLCNCDKWAYIDDLLKM